MALRFAKMDARLDSHPKIRKGGRLAREVYLFVLRVNADRDLSGRVPADFVEAWYVARELDMPEAEAAEGLVRAIAVRLLARDGNSIRILGWDDEWAKAPLSGAERVQRYREKSKDSGDQGSPVTARNDASVTDRYANEGNGSDKKRSEEKRVEEITGRADGAPQPLTLSPEPSGKGKRKPNAAPLPADWAPNADHAAKARVDGTDVKREAEGFRDYHTAKATRFVDWNAAFRSWLGNAVRFGRGGTTPSSKRNDPTATALQSLHDAEELERGDTPHAAEGAA